MTKNMPNLHRPSTNGAGQGVLRTYSIVIALVAAGLLALGCVLLVLQNRQPAQDADRAFVTAANADAALVAARMQLAILQLSRSRDAMEQSLSQNAHKIPEDRPSFELVVNAGAAGKPTGSYLTLPRRDPMRVTEVVGDASIAARAPTVELAAALALAQGFSADHSSYPLLFRSSYVSKRGRFLAVETPVAFGIAKDFMRRWKLDPTLTGEKIFDEVERLAKEIAPPPGSSARAINWTEPYLSYGLSEPQIALIAPVYQTGSHIGTMTKHYLIGRLLTLPAQQRALVGDQIYAVTAANTLIRLSFDPARPARLVQPSPKLAKQLALARSAPAKLTLSGRERLILVPIAQSPWKLFAVGTRPSIVMRAVTLSRATTITLAIFLLICAGTFYAFRQLFLKPAVLLLQRAHDDANAVPAPTVGRLWQPWMDSLEGERTAVKGHVRALEEQNQLRNAILASAIDAIVTSNAEGVITEFNPAAEAMFGWPRSDIVGRTMEATIVPPRHRDAHRNGMARSLATGETRAVRRKIQLEGLRRDGSVFPVELAIAHATVSDQRLFIGYIRDLTAQKLNEAELLQSREALHQSEKLASLGSLLAGVAHELNNPLAIVVGRAAILEEKLVASPLLPSLQKLRAAADRCSRIVKTFLAMARQSGPRRSRVQLNDLVEGALDMSAYGLRTDGVEVQLDLYAALPDTLADGDQLVQVLINLIVNAQHAMAKAPPPHRLTVRTRHAKSANAVILEVEDTGPGVPADLATRIFEPFFTTKDVGAGTGMGLSVSKGMVEAQGGSLTLISKANHGAIFRVSLPIRRNEDGAPETVDAPLVEDAAGRVLVVEDEPELAELLVDCLTPLGVACDIAPNGKAALARLAERRYDAILTDVRMPVMDGVTLYEHVQAQYPRLAGRLAFISGDVLQNDKARLAAIADCPVIEKPFNPRMVREMAMQLLNKGDDI